MRAFEVSLKDLYDLRGGRLECLLADFPMDKPNPDWKRPAVIVVPGGAYEMVSKREGEPVASFFLAKGFQAFVLTYACHPDGVRYPEQLVELACAVDHVRKHAGEYDVNPGEIFVAGFSAGGHLAGNLAVEYASVSEKAGKELDCRPTAVCLGYPVITNKTAYTYTHDTVLDGYTDAEKTELLKTLNLDEAVTENTPPAFIWTTATDPVVPAENAIRYALALARHNVAYELHVYPQGGHGMSACNCEIGPLETWTRKNAHWLEECTAFFRLMTKENF